MDMVPEDMMMWFGGGAAAPSSLMTGLTAFWSLDEASGDRVDRTGRYNLVQSGSPLALPSKLGNVASLNPNLALSEHQGLTCADAAGLRVGSNPFHVSFRIYLLDAGTTKVVCGKWSSIGGNKREWHIWVSSSSIKLTVSPDGTNTGIATVSVAIKVYTWYQVDAWKDPANGKIYISLDNGTPISANCAFDVYAGNNAAFEIAAEDGAYCPIRISRFGFWGGRILTSDERTTKYNNGFPLDYPFSNITPAAYSPGLYFDKYASNPFTLPGGGVGAGNTHPCVVYFPNGEDGYKYWMYLENAPAPTSADNVNINLVRSNDGLTWVATGITNPIIDIPVGAHDPDVVKVGSAWYLYCTDGTDPHTLSFTSTDGKTWTDQQDSLLKGDAGAWDDNAGIVSPSVVYDGVTFWMYFTGRSSDLLSKVGVATSSDGRTFTKYASNPILLPVASTWEANDIWHLGAAIYNSTFYLYYMARQAAGSNGRFGLATSADGLAFTRFASNPVLASTATWEGTLLYRPFPMRDATGNLVLIGGKVQLYYGANNAGMYSVGLATG